MRKLRFALEYYNPATRFDLGLDPDEWPIVVAQVQIGQCGQPRQLGEVRDPVAVEVKVGKDDGALSRVVVTSGLQAAVNPQVRVRWDDRPGCNTT